MTGPLADIVYRIQSADHLTYIEVLDQSASSPPVGLRPLKDTNRQHWKFVKSTTDGQYAIVNVANNQHLRRFNVITTDPTFVAWNIDFRNDSYDLHYDSNGVYHLQPLDTDITKIDALSPQPKNQDSRRWNFIPIKTTPLNYGSLPSGDYRIRSLDGRSLLTMPIKDVENDPGVYVDAQLPECANQRWSISVLPSGRYNIKSDSNSTKPYLGYKTGNNPPVGDSVVCLSAKYEWEIRSVGGFAWSICAPWTDPELAVGVPDFEVRNGDKMTLAKRDSTPSQIWFFEKHVTLNPEQVHIKRQPGIEDGNYVIQGAASSQADYMNVKQSPWRITPGNEFDHMFKLGYKDDSPRFTLTYSSEDKTLFVIVDYDNRLSFSTTKGTEFVLSKRNKDAVGYHICLAQTPQKVVSTRTNQDENSNDRFIIEDLKEDDRMQMWRL